MLYEEFLKNREGQPCPFCDHANNRILLDRPHAYLTYGLAPYHKHHLMVIPHRHVEIILDLTDEEIADMEALQEIGMRVLKKLGYRNLTILEREGDAAAKSVPHLHTHIIPNVRIGDLDHAGNPRSVMTEAEVDALMTELEPLVKVENEVESKTKG